MTEVTNFIPSAGIETTSNTPDISASNAPDKAYQISDETAAHIADHDSDAPKRDENPAEQAPNLGDTQLTARLARARALDQFYTPDDVAELCVETFRDVVKPQPGDWFFEPSAGAAPILNKLPGDRCVGIDIDPAADNVMQADFLTYTPPKPEGRILTIGNPPYGRQSSLAHAFIARAAEFSSYIGFILPPSILKPSQLNRLPPSLHVVHTLELKDVTFMLCDEPHTITCVFVIFERRDVPRAVIVQRTSNPDFTFVSSAAEADFAMRRVGGHAGKLIETQGAAPNARGLSKQSNYFIKARTLPADVLYSRFAAIDFCAAVKPALGPACLSKGEMIAAYERIYGQ